MTEYMTEQEQIEQLKNWIKQYGLTILTGVLLSIIIVTCWHYWQQRQLRILTHASNIYDEMLTLRAQNQMDSAVAQANKLLDHYTKTPYASMAAFMLARDAAVNKHYPEAIVHLTWVDDHSNSKAMRAIANARLARVLIAEDKAQDALNTLEKIRDPNFKALADEVRGDAYLNMHDIDKAKATYQIALQELPSDEVTRKPILQMKLDNLAMTDDKTA